MTDKIDRTADNVHGSLNLAIRCVDDAIEAMVKSGDTAWVESERELFQIEKTLMAIRSLASVKAAARREATA